MNSIGSAHADRSGAPVHPTVSTTDRMLFINGSYVMWTLPLCARNIKGETAGRLTFNHVARHTDVARF